MMLLLLAPSFAEAAPQSAAYHLDQARQFVKNKWYDDAAEQIEAALAAGGEADFEVNWLGAQVYQELTRMDRAAALARRAADLAPNAGARDRCAALVDYLESSWGQLQITAPYDAMRSRVQVEPTSPVIDPEEKRLLNKIALDLRDNVTLPVTVSLPVGDYLVNGVAVSVTGGGSSSVALQLDQLGARGLAALQVSRLEVSPGAVARWGSALGGTSIGPSIEVAFTQPIGPVLLGVVADWEPRGYATIADSTSFTPSGGSAGLRIGRELAVGGPVAIRPSAGIRYTIVTGVRMDCTWTDPTRTAATCGPPGAADADLAAYAPAQGVAPFGELAAEYRQAGRTTALGVGVKLAIEDAIVFLPGDGAISLVDGSTESIRYQSDVGAVNLPGVRLAATLDFAF